MVMMMVSTNGQVPTSITWDQGGTNQTFTELSSSHRQGVSPGGTFMTVWYIQNPTPGTKTFRIVNNGAIGIAFNVSTYKGANPSISLALPAADVQMGTTTSNTQWNVTQSADQEFTFHPRKIGIIMAHCQNSIGNGFTLTNSSGLDGFHGFGFYRKTMSPIGTRITPNTQPDGGLGGIF